MKFCVREIFTSQSLHRAMCAYMYRETLISYVLLEMPYVETQNCEIFMARPCLQLQTIKQQTLISVRGDRMKVASLCNS